MSTRYLPRLKDGTENELMRSSEIGVWDDDPAPTRLHALANAIYVQPGATQIHSIPDPWARVILFSRALFDPRHTLHRRVLGEWRGVLAILGLKDIRKFSELTVAPVALDREDAPAGGFLATVARMKPSASEAFASDGSWDNFHIFRWCGKLCTGDHRPFGMTSTATLVATGTFYQDVFSHDEVPWFVDGYLVDPVTPLDGEDEPPGNLSKGDRTALAEWILHVRSRLLKVGENVRHGELLDSLADYAHDLSEQARMPTGNDFLSAIGIGVVEPEYFECLDKPRKPAALVLTDLQILANQKVDKTYVLYDPSLARQLKKKDRDVTVFDTITMSSAARDLAGISTRKSGPMPGEKSGEILWCTPGFFFEDDLIYEQLNTDSSGDGGSRTFPGCRSVDSTGPSQDRHIVLPLTEDAARLFSPSYLAENFSIEWLTSGGARCRLRLKIQSMRNRPANSRTPQVQEELGPSSWVVIEHVYGEKDLNKIRNLPLVCLWPNFRFDDEVEAEDAVKEGDGGFRNRWKRYYLFENWIGSSKAEELVVTPLDKEGMQRQLFSKNGTFQVTSTPRFPEVLVCQMPFTDKKPKLNDNRPPRGLLLLQDAVRPASVQGLRMALGVDFGTTGTSIYRAQMTGTGSTASPMPMTFSDHRILKITGRSEDELKDATRHYFIPAKIKALGRILSVYQAHDSGAAQPEILNGHVLFQDPDVNGRSAFVWGSEETVIRDLKWGDEKLQSDAAEAFLTQACMQSLAELVAEGASLVDLRYSYPTAFDDNDLHRFKGIWNKVIDEIRKMTSVTITANAGRTENYEAVAAARYFANTSDMSYTNGAITLDIGGGTTDIAVWNTDGTKNAALIAHSSVLFAGTDMFQAVLRERFDLLAQIDPNFGVLKRNNDIKRQSGYFAEVDALISKHGDQLVKRLSRACGESDDVREFAGILELGMSGIAFYSGLVLGHLVQKGSYDAEPSLLQVFVGGNASKLLNWCDLGDFHEGSPFYKKFTGCILAGGQVGAVEKLKDKTVEVVVSDHPKEEVAYGLVSSDLDTVKASGYASPLAGENFRIGDSEVKSWNTAPGISALLEGGLKVERDLPIFSTFLAAIDEELSMPEKEKIVGKINGSLMRMIQRTAKQQKNDEKTAREMKKSDRLNPVRQEPLFILALKGFIDMRIAKLVKGA